MSAQRVRIQLRASGPLRDIAAHGVRVEAVPLGAALVLTCTGREEALRKIADSAGPDHAIRSAAGAHASLTLVVEPPAEVVELLRALDETRSFLLPPVVWEGDAATLDAMTSEPRALVEALPQARLASLSPVAAASAAASDFATRLTRRQAQALTTALELGYYDAPRRATAGDVAAAMGIGRSTFEEHLRAAEGSAIRLLAPILRLHARTEEAPDDAARADALQVYARFSHQLGLYVEMGIRNDRVSRLRLLDKPSQEPLAGTHPHLDAVLRHLESGAAGLDQIPVDAPASAFQGAVYAALREIPPGATATYAEIARRIGRPGAARAVGTACAKNPVLLLIPCHRVVPASGLVGSYAGAGGGATKALLLDLERARAKKRVTPGS